MLVASNPRALATHLGRSRGAGHAAPPAAPRRRSAAAHLAAHVVQQQHALGSVGPQLRCGRCCSCCSVCWVVQAGRAVVAAHRRLLARREPSQGIAAHQAALLAGVGWRLQIAMCAAEQRGAATAVRFGPQLCTVRVQHCPGSTPVLHADKACARKKKASRQTHSVLLAPSP